MSVRVMSMVFERYPNGGGEMLLALALADHAHDDGTNIRPGIALLAQKTRQSERAVQYQLRKMEKSGWLELTNNGDGGRNIRREYRISPAWLKGEEFAPIKTDDQDNEKGEEFAPFEMEKGANDDNKGCKSEHERVQIEAEKGAKLLHPHITITEPSVEPSVNRGEMPIPRASTNRPLPATTANPNGTFAMHLDWRPNDRFDDMLRFAGLPDYPWQDELPEFVLYRLGQSEAMSQGSWEHRFVQTLKRNAARREQSGKEPTPLPVDWEPDREIVSALLASGLTRKFLDDALLTFTAFWRDAGNAHRSWNAKFIEHVRHQQATQPQTLHKSTYENLTDRSWAEGIVPRAAAKHSFIEKHTDPTWREGLLDERESL